MVVDLMIPRLWPPTSCAVLLRHMWMLQRGGLLCSFEKVFQWVQSTLHSACWRWKSTKCFCFWNSFCSRARPLLCRFMHSNQSWGGSRFCRAHVDKATWRWSRRWNVRSWCIQGSSATCGYFFGCFPFNDGTAAMSFSSSAFIRWPSGQQVPSALQLRLAFQ